MFDRRAAHLLALIAAIALALGAAPSAGPIAHARAQGFEVVVCAGGEVRTVVIGEDGKPIDPARDDACPVSCLCGLTSGSDAPVLPEGLSVDRAVDAGTALFATGAAAMRDDRALRRLQARGPPMKAGASCF